MPTLRLLPFVLSFWWLILFAPFTVNAASFDCSADLTATEERICTNPELSDLDSELGELYQGLRDDLSSSDQESMRAEQRLWLQQRNDCADEICLLATYKTRLAELNQQWLALQYEGQAVTVVSVQEEGWDNAAALVVRLNVPVDANADWRQFLRVTRAGEAEPQDLWLLDESGRALIYPFVEPSTDYRIQIQPGLPAINGNRLIPAGQHNLTTRRTEPSFSFTSSGQVLSTALSRALPVTTLNVDAVEVDFFRIDPERISQWSSYTNNQRRYYYQLEGFTRANPLVYSARFPIDHRRNQRTTTNLDLSEIAELDDVGAYLAVLRQPGRYEYALQTAFFTVSDIGVQVRRQADQMRVYTRSIVSGDVRSDVVVELYGNEGLVASSKVSETGEAVFGHYHQQGHTLLARQGEELTVLRYDRNPLDLSGYDNATTRHSAQQVFAWGPRDLYRPGESVEVSALLRDYDGVAQASLPIQAQLFDASGNQAFVRTLHPEASGRYRFRFDLETSSPTGGWRLQYRIPGQSGLLHEYRFSVEEFLPERMSLTLFDGDVSQRHRFASKDSIALPVQGDYLYGAPAAGNRLDGFVIAELDRHPFERWSGYYFGIDGESLSTTRLNLTPQTLDAEGYAEIPLPVSHWSQVQSPLALTANISLYESGGRPVTRRATVTNILAEQLVGLEPQFRGRPGNNSRVAFNAILTNAEGDRLEGSNYRVSLIREDRNYYWTYSDNEGWRWHYDPLNYEVFGGRLDFDAQSPTRIDVPVEWGNYRLEVRDAENRLQNRYRFSTRWSGWSRVSDDSLRPDQVLIAFEDSQYQPGDTATAHLTPPTDGLARITVESNEAVYWHDLVQLEAAGTELQLPIGENWNRHDLYLTVTLLTPGDMTHSVAPKRSLGLAHLPIERADARLELELRVPERSQPRQALMAELELNGEWSSDEPIWVSVAAVDVGVLNITRFQTPDPAAYFYGARRYDYQLYDIYGQIIENAGFATSRQRFGGGFEASEAELARGGQRPDSEVQIVSLQAQPVQFDEDGRAFVSLAIPDFNGRLRWMAVAWSDRSYGSAEAETRVADPLIAQLSRPRFMALGDESRLTLDLVNQSEARQEISLELTASGGLIPQQWYESLTLEEGERQVLTFPVHAMALEPGDISLRIVNADRNQLIDIDRQWRLGIRSAYPSITRKLQSVIEPGSLWQPDLELADLINSTVQGQLIIADRPPIDLASHFDALLRYPYGCTEQTTSAAFPWVWMTPNLADQLGVREGIEHRLRAGFTEGLRREQLEHGVSRVLARQTGNGGFGLWSNSDGETHWLSVYATDFLVEAQKVGTPVPSADLDRALNRLDAYLREQVQVNERWSDDASYYSLATRAYAAYVLARSGKARLPDLRRLHSRMEGRLDQSGLPWAHLGYALQQAGDPVLAEAALQLASDLDDPEGVYYGDYGSGLRDNALTIAVLARAGIADSDRLLRLFDQVKERRWLSTQERNALFQAAMASSFGRDEPWSGRILAADFEQTLSQTDAFRTLLDFDQMTSLHSIEAQDDTLYVSLEWIGESLEPPEPVQNSLWIQRDLYDLDGQPTTLERLETGSLVIVRLTVGAERSIPDGLVVDFLPAGLELENPNLAQASVDIAQLSVEGEPLGDWRSAQGIRHVEYRDDRFVAAVELGQYYRTQLYYLARAVTPGEYRIPPAFVEDMYRPYYHAIGSETGVLVVTGQND